jgi:hypothetical protein
MSAAVHFLTAQQICDATGISRRMFFNAVKLRRDGCAELLDQVQAGTVPMSLALALTRFDHDSQRLILAEFQDVRPRSRAGFVALVWAGRSQVGAA